MNQYSTDLRSAACRMLDTGMSQATVARTIGVSRTSVRRWDRLRTVQGSPAAKKRSGRPPRLDLAARATLSRHVAAQPEATLAERQAHLATTHGVTVSVATVARTLAALEITHKKRPSGPGSKTRLPVPPGRPTNRSLIPPVCSFSMKPAPR
jgi:transposase